MYRSTRGVFAYVWEIYNGANFALYLPVYIAGEVKLYEINSDYRLSRTGYSVFMTYFRTGTAIQIDIILREGTVTIAIDQKIKKVTISYGDNFGSQHEIPKEHYDDFVSWVEYVLTLWRNDLYI